MEENNRKIQEAQRKLVSVFFFFAQLIDSVFDVGFAFKAEDQLKLVEDQRKIIEERQRIEDSERRRAKQEQDIVLNKKNARPKLSFSLGKAT